MLKIGNEISKYPIKPQFVINVLFHSKNRALLCKGASTIH